MHIGSLDDIKATAAHGAPSRLAPFFGANVPAPAEKKLKRGDHICTPYSTLVLRCLEEHENDFTRCQGNVAAFNKCLNENGTK